MTSSRPGTETRPWSSSPPRSARSSRGQAGWPGSVATRSSGDRAPSRSPAPARAPQAACPTRQGLRGSWSWRDELLNGDGGHLEREGERADRATDRFHDSHDRRLKAERHGHCHAQDARITKELRRNHALDLTEPRDAEALGDEAAEVEAVVWRVDRAPGRRRLAHDDGLDEYVDAGPLAQGRVDIEDPLRVGSDPNVGAVGAG